MNKRKLPDDAHPEAKERFNRLLMVMATELVAATVCESPSEESETLNEVTDEDCAGTQTSTNTSEDAS